MDIPTYKLHNGNPIPCLGLGTFRMKTIEELKPVVIEAIRSGYRLIEVLGKILKDIFADTSLNITRQDLFITSKLCKDEIQENTEKDDI
ncbi:unnamed protein product [Cunninghamella echinulata]